MVAPMDKLLSWLPPVSALREKEFPRFHQELLKYGRGDLSFKIDSCNIPGMRLDCEYDPSHSVILAVSCHRRICPHCSKSEMSERITRYKDIADRTEPSGDGQEKYGYRLRFWTFTELALPGKCLRKPALALSKAIHRWWRTMYGGGSKYQGGPFEDVGGLFCIEVGEGWNVHAHALIFGPYHGIPDKPSRDPIPQLYDCRRIWIHSLKKAGWSGDRIHVEEVYDPKGSIVELISYPLNPEKRYNLDERLLAHIELGFSGRNARSKFNLPGIPSIRRYIAKGSWYNEFHKGSHKLLCNECFNNYKYNNMIREPGYDDFLGRHFKRDYFDSQEKWNNRLKYIDPEIVEEKYSRR